MKSPFPGMDPYLELHWRDVHHSLCTYARDALQPQIAPALKARIDERLVVEDVETGESRGIMPDVHIVERQQTPIADSSAIATAEPLVVWDEDSFEGFIQIIEPSGKLVTVIEFLSPTNKTPGEGHRQYLQKQRELRQAGVSLVEIDLVRSGAWTLQVPLRQLPPAYRAALYHAVVRRSWRGEKSEVYACPLQQPLPTIRIPLRESDPADAKLDLQALVDQVYRNGAYDDLEYSKPLDPPLPPEQMSWLNERLKSSQRQ